ncbi:probable 39S ribosomal protein L49, mitochondrial [Condylostylus longicornis]|uniref:probable 39S ribosomal protein L49, mitochondrial n=1 Tax=Condylostylus longicornis TaxID=2530218 RepID=UPI00244E51B2|nr:probable 39S ribosomal protein L49, mitochondrial [Condylostylus longicornis]
MNILRTVNLIVNKSLPKDLGANQLKLNEILKRCSSFRSSNNVRDINEYPEVEILKNPPEWKYVNMLLKQPVVPKPTSKAEYPSGWTPATANPSNVKYFINRTRNYMIPVYLKTAYRGQRRLTLIRKIEGDIWLFEKDIRQHVESNIGKICATRVNELCGQITIYGDHVNLVRSFLISKGF